MRTVHRLILSLSLAAGAAALPARALACEGDDAPKAAAEPAVPAGAATVVYTIDGMHCAGCSGKIEAAVRKLDGVYTVSVDIEKRTARVAYDPKKTKPEKIKAAISKAGFKPDTVA